MVRHGVLGGHVPSTHARAGASSLAVTLVLTLAIAWGTSAQRSAEPDELLSLYDRGAWEAFDERIRVFAAAPGSVRAFRRAADRWIDAGQGAERRRVIAAAVTVELAAVLSDWDAGPDFLDAGRNWMRSAGESEAARHWYRAALGTALAHGDSELLLDVEEDVQRQLHAGEAALTPAHVETASPFRPVPAFRRYANDALRRFRGDPVLLLFKAIATAHRPVLGESDYHLEWLDRDAIEHYVRSITGWRGGGQPLPGTVRMDIGSVERLFKPDVADLLNVRPMAMASLRLWLIAGMFQDLQKDPAIAAEASLRLGATYEQLARPDLALSQFERALASSPSPFVTYTAHFLRARQFERAGRFADAESAYWLALRAVPHAQSASFALASLLFESNRRSEAEGLAAGALRVPLASDPLKMYHAGDPRHLHDALARLRQESR